MYLAHHELENIVVIIDVVITTIIITHYYGLYVGTSSPTSPRQLLGCVTGPSTL